MKLDYIDNFNSFGDKIVRLYDFDKSEALKFRQAIEQTILFGKNQLILAKLDFIQMRNCKLTLRISEEDRGMMTGDNINFYCDLTIKGYKQMVLFLEPFCKKETKGHQFLYDLDTETDFLFSPGGTW